MDATGLALGFGLLSALTWGAGDFGGGMAAKTARPQAVVLWTSLLGGLLFLALAQARQEPFRPQDLPFALLGGALGAVGLYSLYQALAQGTMSLAAPVAGVVGAALPVAWGLLQEGWPGTWPALGLGVGLWGVWLASRPEGKAKPLGLPWAFLAGLGFGGFYVLMDRVEGLLWPAASGKLTAFALVLLFFPRPKVCTAALNLDHLTGQFSQGSHPLSTGSPKRPRASCNPRPSEDAYGCTPGRQTAPPRPAPPPGSCTPARPPTPL
jgi:drug/metabolite transporter (DMT)-like permease